MEAEEHAANEKQKRMGIFGTGPRGYFNPARTEKKEKNIMDCLMWNKMHFAQESIYYGS